MSFGSPSSPPPMIAPPTPPPPMQMTQPTSAKPPKKASQASFIGEALAPGQRETGARSLIGGAPSALGA
jgi:hypothetical protein